MWVANIRYIFTTNYNTCHMKFLYLISSNFTVKFVHRCSFYHLLVMRLIKMHILIAISTFEGHKEARSASIRHHTIRDSSSVGKSRHFRYCRQIN